MQIKNLRTMALAITTTALLTAVVVKAEPWSRPDLARQTPQGPAPEPPFLITLRQAQEIEAKQSLPITKFYDTPEPLPRGEPGDLIRAEEFAEYSCPWFRVDLQTEGLGIKTVRFLYHSQSVSGQDVPASGVIMIPYGKPPAGGWPVIVWGHGTSGVARPFAPSLMKDLYYSWAGLLQWTMLGYAVVAPDYAGLGTNVPHQYLAYPAHAQDIINAVPAAREAVPELGAKWVAIGHSQGGSAVLMVSEMQGKIKDKNYLGAISLAPVGDLEAWMELISKRYHGYAALVAYGIKAVYPEFEYGDILTPEAVKLMPVVRTGGWYATLATFAPEMEKPGAKMLLPKWRENRHFQEYRKLSLFGQRSAFGPILLLGALEDKTIPPAMVAAVYESMRKQGAAIAYKTYAGIDHSPLMFTSFKEQIQWVQDRFDGKAATDKK